jgi:signal transduction histidine kinase
MLALVGVGSAGGKRNADLLGAALDAYATSHEQMKAADNLRAAWLTVVGNLDNSLLTKSLVEEPGKVDDAISAFIWRLSRFHAIAGPGDTPRAARIRRLIDELNGVGTGLAAIISDLRRESREGLWDVAAKRRSGEFERSRVLLESGLDRLDAEVEAALGEATASAESARIEGNNFMIAIIAVATAVAVAAAFLVMRRVIRPLNSLIACAGRLGSGDMGARVAIQGRNEWARLGKAFDGMAAEVEHLVADLHQRVAELERKDVELSQARDSLEEKVLERTASLERANDELAGTLERLKLAQDHLVRSEKMAALGGLVAGVAHEINTPVGIGVTGASHLAAVTKDVAAAFESGRLTREELSDYLGQCVEGTSIILSNLESASRLVRSFKQVAVDQSTEARRSFVVSEYLREIVTSLKPKVSRAGHTVAIDCPEDAKIDGYPGAFSQVISILVMNSLAHAFPDGRAGRISISFREGAGRCRLDYSDDGIGIPGDVRPRVFDPFFTTARSAGGTGLGLYVLYNIVTQQFEGTVECTGVPGGGARFSIEFPAKAPDSPSAPLS